MTEISELVCTMGRYVTPNSPWFRSLVQADGSAPPGVHFCSNIEPGKHRHTFEVRGLVNMDARDVVIHSPLGYATVGPELSADEEDES